MRASLFCSLLCAAVASHAAAEPSAESLRGAAQAFDRGEVLYRAGRYREAIQSFAQANAVAPHPAALFNIARCHENLGEPDLALTAYERALGFTTDPARALDIRDRIERLKTRPVRIFVTSTPSGAHVTVDGRPQAEAAVTPAIVELAPGVHVLLLAADGHELAAERVEVEPGKPKTVVVALRARQPVLAPGAACARERPCPPAAQSYVDYFKGLHVHLSAPLSVGLTTGRAMTPGTGVQCYGTWDRFTFGGTLHAFLLGEGTVNDPQNPSRTLSLALRWLVFLIEGGYVLPFENFYIQLAGGAGVSADRIVYDNLDPTTGGNDRVTERFAFAWAMGGGVEARVLSWLSLGTHFRGGLIHGTRSSRENPGAVDDSGPFPLLQIWGTVSFHL